MNDHLTDIGARPGRPELGGARPRWPPLAHHVPGQVARPRRPVGHVPPPDGAGQGGDGPGPRHGRPVHPRPRRRLVRAASTCRSASRSRRCPSGSTGSSRRVHDDPGAVLGRGRARRPASPAPTRSIPLVGATNDPPPLTPGGPPIWLGGQKRRGIALAAAVADGWLLPGGAARQVPDRHDLLQPTGATRSCAGARRRSGGTRAAFALVAQVPAGTTAETGAWPSRRRGSRRARGDPRDRRHAAAARRGRAWPTPRGDRRAAARGDRR